MMKYSLIIKTVFSMLIGGLAVPALGQITMNTALPVTEGNTIIRMQTKFIRSTGDPSSMNRDLIVQAVPLVAVHGITERLAVFGVVPYLNKRLQVNTPLGRKTRKVQGLADARFFARYTLWQWNAIGETRRIAPFTGVEAPTGQDDATDGLGRLPQPLQLGSGSWDYFGGLVFTWQTLHWQIDVAPSYQYNSPANNFRFGQVVRLDAQGKYRVLPRRLGNGVPGFFYANLETNLIWQGKNQIDGTPDPNSGGATWYLVPGIQYVTVRAVLEAAIRLPVVQRLHGSALKNDFITTLSMRINI